MKELLELVLRERAIAAQRPPAEIPVLRPESRERFAVAKEAPGRFRVEGERTVTFVEMMDTGMEGAVDEIIRRLERWGVAKALRRAGIAVGDEIWFGETVINWRD